jgi:hypothetical protein
MKRERIYLIGQISMEAPITYEWRQDVRKYFADKPMFEMIDPCDNEFNETALANNIDDPHRLKVYKTKNIELIVPKDCSYVKRSSGCIANMNHYDLQKPFVGTLFELAWYYLFQEKCVIGVLDGDPEKNMIGNHPFVRAAVDTWVQTPLEAAEVLEYFYRRSDYDEEKNRNFI